MHATEIKRLADVEAEHWWWVERRAVLTSLLREVPVNGWSADIGAAAGGNTAVHERAGWRALAVEYSESGSRLAHKRGHVVCRGDAHVLPISSGSLGLVTVMDVLEHLPDDVRAAREIWRVLRPDGRLILSVPCDPRLWSEHDVALGHHRRYTRTSLQQLLVTSGFEVERLWSWNVLLRPVAQIRRRAGGSSDLDAPSPAVNRIARSVVALERRLPVRRFPGLSLMAVCRPVQSAALLSTARTGSSGVMVSKAQVPESVGT